MSEAKDYDSMVDIPIGPKSIEEARKAYDAVYGKLGARSARMVRCVELMSSYALGAYNAVLNRSAAAGNEQAKIYEAGMYASLYFTQFEILKCLMSEFDEGKVVAKVQNILDFVEKNGWNHTVRFVDEEGREVTKLASGVHVDMGRYLETRAKLVKATNKAREEVRK